MASDEQFYNANADEPALDPLQSVGPKAEYSDSAASPDLPPIYHREIDTLYKPSEAEGESHGSPVLIQLPKQSKAQAEPQESEEVAEISQGASRPRTPEQLEKAKYRQEVYFRMRREKKKKKVFLHRLRKIAKLIFLGVMIAGFYWAATTPIWDFSLQRDGFKLHGNHLLQPEAFYPILNPFDHQPIYRVDPSRIKNAIMTDIPMVEDVYVRRHLFPTGLDITVAEKPVWGLLYSQPPVQPSTATVSDTTTDTASAAEALAPDAPAPPRPSYLIHWDGTMTDLARFPMTEDMQDKLSFTVNLVGQRSHLDKAHLLRYRDIAYVLNQNPTDAKLQYLDITNPFDIYGQFDGFRVRVGRADVNVITRLNRLFHIIPQIREQQDNIDYVDLRWDNQVTLRKKTGGSSDPVSEDLSRPQ